MARLLAGALVLIVSACAADSAEPPTSATSLATTTTAGAPTTSVMTSTTTMPEAAHLEALEAAATAYGAQGAVAVLLIGTERWAGAYGVADQSGTSVDVAMRFRAGSITKTVIATLAVLRAEDGNLDLDAPVNDLLPGILAEPPVTTRQLLQHTSGIFDLGNEGDLIAALGAIPDPAISAEALSMVAAWQDGARLVMPAEFAVRAAETEARYFDPGTGYHYSNPGYQVVGMVLEQVTSGLNPSILLEQRLVIPHGLASMSLAPYDDSSPELRGLEVAATGFGSPDNTDDLFTFGNGGPGGLLTNADDLARFFRLLLAGEIFETVDVATMIEPSAPSMDAGVPYGLGLATYELACGTFYGHSGSVNGTVSIAIADRTGDRVVVAAFNTLRRQTDARLLALAETLICG
jgi:D-alanyl-D-alanine carboxypeptidase